MIGYCCDLYKYLRGYSCVQQRWTLEVGLLSGESWCLAGVKHSRTHLASIPPNARSSTPNSKAEFGGTGVGTKQSQKQLELDFLVLYLPQSLDNDSLLLHTQQWLWGAIGDSLFTRTGTAQLPPQTTPSRKWWPKFSRPAPSLMSNSSHIYDLTPALGSTIFFATPSWDGEYAHWGWTIQAQGDNNPSCDMSLSDRVDSVSSRQRCIFKPHKDTSRAQTRHVQITHDHLYHCPQGTLELAVHHKNHGWKFHVNFLTSVLFFPSKLRCYTGVSRVHVWYNVVDQRGTMIWNCCEHKVSLCLLSLPCGHGGKLWWIGGLPPTIPHLLPVLSGQSHPWLGCPPNCIHCKSYTHSLIQLATNTT